LFVEAGLSEGDDEVVGRLTQEVHPPSFCGTPLKNLIRLASYH
jgi:hypothetical protein